MGAKKATIKDISKQTGYSVATVSRVINGKGVFYGKEAETKINNAIKEMDYIPHAIARELKNKKTYSIGYIVPYLDDYYSQVFLGVQSCANENGYTVVLLNSNFDKKQEDLNIKNVKEQRYAGLIVAAGFMNYNMLCQLQQEMCIVTIGKIMENQKIPYVTINDYEIAREATDYLISLGHKRIAYLTGPLDIISEKERYGGYLAALQENGIEADPSLVFEKFEFVKNTFNESYTIVKRIMEERTDITAFFITTDYVAIAALKAMTDLGKKVPDDISIIGFDNLPITEFYNPTVTTVSQDKFTIGCKSMETLIDIINGNRVYNTIINGELIVRESAGKARDYSQDLPGRCKMSESASRF